MSQTSKVLILLVGAVAAVCIAWSVPRAHRVWLEKPDDPIRAFLRLRTAKVPACQWKLRQIGSWKDLWADNESKTPNDTPT